MPHDSSMATPPANLELPILEILTEIGNIYGDRLRLSARQVSRLIDAPYSTTHKYMRSLADRGLVARVEGEGYEVTDEGRASWTKALALSKSER